MPVPLPSPVPASQPTTSPTAPGGIYTRAVQHWAIDQERARHDQALYQAGEYAMFVLMWTARDYDANLVGLCTLCATDRTAKAYGQGARNKCPDCYGTRFEGGYRALIVRPTIFTDADDSQQFTARGVVAPQELNLETTQDFRVHQGDYCFRATGERLQLREPARTTLRTGFATVHQAEAGVSYGVARASVEDDSSVAHTIPPTNHDDLVAILTRSGPRPVDFSDVEVLRAPLIPLYERD